MNKPIITGIVGLVVGIVLSGAIAGWAVNGNHTRVAEAYAMDTSKFTAQPTNTNDVQQPVQGSMSMTNMTASLQGKTGDEFDKTFISEMIMHHQGAIDMAKLAKTNAKHQEIKSLADNIISAQTSEITEMQNWQMQWGYASGSMPGMNH